MTSCVRLSLATTMAILVVANSSAADGGPIDLSPERTPGVTTYIEFTWDNDDTEEGTEYPPNGRRRRSIITYGFLHTVERVSPDGSARIRLTADRAAITVTGDDIDLHFDTDSPKKARDIATYGRKLQSLLGESFGFTVGGDGRVGEIEGTEKLVKLAAPGESDAYGDDVATMFICLTAAVQANVWRQYYGYFSCKPVKPGDTWTRQMFGHAPLDIHYKLEHIEGSSNRRRAVVSHIAHLDASPGWEKHGDVLSQPGWYDASGRTVIDVDAGRVVSSEETVDQTTRTKILDANGTTVWWVAAKSSAKHTLVVLTADERRQAKRAAGNSGTTP